MAKKHNLDENGWLFQPRLLQTRWFKTSIIYYEHNFYNPDENLFITSMVKPTEMVPTQVEQILIFIIYTVTQQFSEIGSLQLTENC